MLNETLWTKLLINYEFWKEKLLKGVLEPVQMFALLLRRIKVIISITFGQHYEAKFVADCLPTSHSMTFLSLNLTCLC